MCNPEDRQSMVAASHGEDSIVEKGMYPWAAACPAPGHFGREHDMPIRMAILSGHSPGERFELVGLGPMREHGPN